MPAPVMKSENGSWVVIVKTGLCAVAFVAATAFFALSCKALMEEYTLVLTPSVAETLPWLMRAGAGAFLVMLLFGVMVVLVRPITISIAAIVAGCVAYAVLLGAGSAAWFGAGAGAAMLLGLLLSVVKQFENQIEFSIRPVSGKELALSSILAILVAVPVGMGYAVDAEQGSYVVPPRIIMYATEQLNANVDKLVQTELVPEALRGAATEAARDQVGVMVAGLEKMAAPFAAYVPYALGLLAYFTAQIALFIPGLAASLLLTPVIYLLAFVGFAHRKNEMREVTRLTLAKVEREPAPAEAGKDPWVGVK